METKGEKGKSANAIFSQERSLVVLVCHVVISEPCQNLSGLHKYMQKYFVHDKPKVPNPIELGLLET